MNLSDILFKAEKLIRSNSPAILTAFGVSGTITTAYLAVKSGMQHEQIVPPGDRVNMSKREEAETVWRVYIPPAVAGSVTIICIIGAARAGSRRTAALTAAYSLTDKAFTEYREHVVEALGKGKEQKIRDQIAQERVSNSPPIEGSVIITSGGDVLCCELYTGRYFHSDMETLRKAQNEINRKINAHGEATLSDLYYLINLPWTSNSGRIGWSDNRLMDLEFSAVMSEGNRPCLAFEYNYTMPV